MTVLVVCTTCGYRQDQPDADTPGARLADLVEAALASNSSIVSGSGNATSADSPPLRLQRTMCLMACQRSCSAAVHQSGKYSFVFGDLKPHVDSVEALLSYVVSYRSSETGDVAFSQWPEGIKGRFVARIPPAQLPETE